MEHCFSSSFCSLADSLSGDLSGYEKDWDINGEAVRLSVDRV